MTNGTLTIINQPKSDKPPKRATMEHFIVVSLNYKSISLKSLTKFAVSEDALDDLLLKLKAKSHIHEIAGIRTCNRLELFATTGSVEYAENIIFDTLATLFDCSYDFISENSFHFSDDLALRHLFRLVSGLESMVVGDAQIFGQVKKGYQKSIEMGSAHKTLHAIFQKAFASAKAVRTKTGLGKGRVSISALAVDYAVNHNADMANSVVTVIGAGKMGVLTVKYLKEVHAKEIHIVNRTVEKCVEIAADANAFLHPIADLDEVIAKSDIVISTTAAQRPIITRGQMEAIDRQSPKPRMLIDITMPIDIDPEVAEIDSVTYVSLEEIQKLAQKNQEQRMGELEKAEEIVERKLNDLGPWPICLRIDEIAKTIGQFANRIYEQELDSLFDSLPELSDKQRDIIQLQMQRVAERIILAPRRALRKADSQTVTPETLQMLGDIFQKEPGTRQNGRVWKS